MRYCTDLSGKLLPQVRYSLEERDAMIDRDGYLCFRCKGNLNDLRGQRAHRVPDTDQNREKYGRFVLDHRLNIKHSCEACNSYAMKFESKQEREDMLAEIVNDLKQRGYPTTGEDCGRRRVVDQIKKQPERMTLDQRRARALEKPTPEEREKKIKKLDKGREYRQERREEYNRRQRDRKRAQGQTRPCKSIRFGGYNEAAPREVKKAYGIWYEHSKRLAMKYGPEWETLAKPGELEKLQGQYQAHQDSRRRNGFYVPGIEETPNQESIKRKYEPYEHKTENQTEREKLKKSYPLKLVPRPEYIEYRKEYMNLHAVIRALAKKYNVSREDVISVCTAEELQKIERYREMVAMLKDISDAQPSTHEEKGKE